MPSLPHFVQVGDAPVLFGSGPETLDCACGASVLVRGYRPGTLLAIGIQCFRCGDVTTTRGLPDGAVLPQALRAIPPAATALPGSIALPDGLALAAEAEIARVDALTRPAEPPRETLTIGPETIAESLAAYDRLTDRLDEHRDAVLRRSNPAAWLPQYPLAWALTCLQDRSGQSGWSWFASHADSAAVAHLGAFRHFLACWSRHPLFPAMAAGAAAEGFSLHALAVFAAAKCLADSGNRVAFAMPPANGRMRGFSLGPADAEGVAATVQRIVQFEWPHGRSSEPAAIRTAVVDALVAAQGQVNLRRPGIVLLSPGAAPANFDQPVVDAMNAVLRAQGRRHRGVTAAAAILPKLLGTPRPDQVGFGWSFYPIANPHAASGATARIGKRDDFAAFDRLLPGG